MWVDADSPSNPYWNGSCTQDCNGTWGGDATEDCNGDCGGSAMIDDCGDCQSGYCYDYVTHEVSFGDCDGATQMWVDADSPSNPYWNGSCTQDCNGTWGGDAMVDDCGVCNGDGSSCAETDCNGVVGGDAMVDDCGDCQSGYCYDYVTPVSYTHLTLPTKA